MSETITCANCATTIHWLEVFPGNFCLACHAKREEESPLPTAGEITQMFKDSIRL